MRNSSSTAAEGALMDRVFTPAEVAGQLKVSLQKVWQLCRTGDLKHVRVSARCYRITESQLSEFVRLAEGGR